MPVQYIGTSTNTVENVADIVLPAHQAGDLIVFTVVAEGSIPVTVPAGYTLVFNYGVYRVNTTVAYVYATSSGTVVPSWGTYVRWMAATVYRNARIGNINNATSFHSPIQYPAVAFQDLNNTSLTYGALASIDPVSPIYLPPGWINVAYKGTAGSITSLAINVNNTPSNGFSGASFTNSGADWSTNVLEIAFSESVSVDLFGVLGVGTTGTATSQVNISPTPAGVLGNTTLGAVSVSEGTSVYLFLDSLESSAVLNDAIVNSANSVVLSGYTITGYVGNAVVPTGLVGVVGELPPPFAAVTIWDRIITSGNV